MEFSDVIKNRYSCKKFSSEQIGKDKLDAILLVSPGLVSINCCILSGYPARITIVELLEIKVIKEAFMMNEESLFFSRIEICGTKY